MKENKKINQKENQEEKTIKEENATKYGEFVCTQFAWLPIDKQKEKTNEMDKMTKDKNIK